MICTPYVIQKFEVYNVVGCGLFDGKNPVGHLLLFNSVYEVRRADWKRAHEVARHFRDVVRHLLVVKHTEQEAYEQERERIAQDLHDGPLQSIISFEMRLQIIRKLLERDVAVASADIESLQVFSRDLVSEMRTFVHRMRPLDTGDTSLLAGARQIVDGFQCESSVSMTFVGNESGSVSVPGKTGIEILQVIREALHNVYKMHAVQAWHARAVLAQANAGRYATAVMRPHRDRRQRTRLSFRGAVFSGRAGVTQDRPAQHQAAHPHAGRYADAGIEFRTRVRHARAGSCVLASPLIRAAHYPFALSLLY